MRNIPYEAGAQVRYSTARTRTSHVESGTHLARIAMLSKNAMAVARHIGGGMRESSAIARKRTSRFGWPSWADEAPRASKKK